MPIGKFGEVIGTMNTFPEGKAPKIDTKVVAPKNPKLLHERAPYVKLTPSEFMFQMSLDTRQKLANTRTMELPDKIELLDMANTTYQKTSSVTMEQPIFQPFPSTITFVNCAANETHEVPLLLRNNDKVPRLVRVGLVTDSPYFRVITPIGGSGGQHKIAAGLAATFRIQYLPDRDSTPHDLHVDLLVTTEREKFIVPVHCVGARALLDFPDKVVFPQSSPVRHKEPRTLFVRNVGTAIANFSITTRGPFSVEPASAIIPIQQGLQITVYFEPQHVRSYQEELTIHLDTGEDLCVQLEGTAQELSVRLEKSRVTLPLTYVGLAGLQTVTINNRSDVLAHYHWSTFPSEQAEEDDRRTILGLWDNEEFEELKKYEPQTTNRADDSDSVIQDNKDIELMASDKSTLISRGFLNRKRLHEQTRPRFTHPVFSIDPPEGTVWPHSSLDVTITFRPPEAREYSTTAFLDITGRENRLSLRMQGKGLGPRVDFSFRILDLGLIFIHSRHSYELLLANKGDIDALFKIEPIQGASKVANCFSFVPDDGLVSPGGHQSVNIRFHSDEFLGYFDEPFYVRMDGCVEATEIRFRGTVIAPTFHFNVPKIRFGYVSLGFPTTQEVVLTNTSLVPLRYHLKVNEEIAESNSEHLDTTSAIRKQFQVVPFEGTISQQSHTTIRITFIGSKLGKLSTYLFLNLVNVPDSGISLPISAHVQVPEIKLNRDLIDFRRCFLRYERIEEVCLINDSDLPARYELIPQDSDLGKIVYRSSESKGILEPQTEKKVPIEIKALTTGEISSTIKFKIIGAKSEQLRLYVKCVGEGPVVNLDRSSIDWGTINVLENKQQTLVMSNESDIPAKFHTNMTKDPDSAFCVTPMNGTLKPHEFIQLILVAHLKDSLRFTDELNIIIEEGRHLIVNLSAHGHGTTIAFEPPLPITGGCWRMDDHFSRRLLEEKVQIINKGKRHQQLVWANEGYSYSKAIRQTGVSKGPKMKTPILTVHPHRFDLSPGESADMFIRGSVDEPQLVSEKLMCHAIIGKQGGKELIKKLELQVNFISPVMQYSSDKIHFRIDKTIHNEFEMLFKSFSLCNVSGLPVTCTVSVTKPFSILDDEGVIRQTMTIHLRKEEEESLSVQFDPLFKKDLHSRKVDQVMKISFEEHPHIDEIKLIGEVNFPNLTFDRTVIDFDCILNHSEVTQFVSMTNNSPLPVHYKWSFIIGDNIKFNRKKPEIIDYDNDKNDELKQIEDRSSKKVIQPTFEIIVDACDKDLNNEKKRFSGISDNIEDDDEMKLPLDLSDDDDDFIIDDEKPTIEPAIIKPIRRESTMILQDNINKNGTINSILKQLLDEDYEIEPLGIEEVFDIKPLFGTLSPNDTERLELTFFGHADIEANVIAECEIEGGPKYRLNINGQSGSAGYIIKSGLEFQMGAVRFQKETQREVIIENTGKVTLDWQTFVVQPNDDDEVHVRLEPPNGRIEPGHEVVLNLFCIPFLPGKFNGTCRIQIAHFPPETLIVEGYGTFPRLQLPNLNRDIYNDGTNIKQLSNEDEDEFISNLLRKNPNIEKLYLPSYILDFGSVILGDITSKELSFENRGAFSVNAKFDRTGMFRKGFSTDAKCISSGPPGSNTKFGVTFDPRAANLDLGKVSAQLIVQMNDGPDIPIRLEADVTMPDLIPSSDIVDFREVQVGQAMLINIQLHNPTPVITQWSAGQLEVTGEFGTRSTATNLNVKKKKKQISEIDKQCPIFEVVPNAGELYPGQKLNVQIKFIPLEGKKYSQRLVLHLKQSSRRVVLRCLGIGMEPELKFEPGMLNFGPVLPFTNGTEQILIVKNPCPFPIEFYNLELDETYEKDEDILRNISGYDTYGYLLIPPRLPGESLPPEFLEHYKKLKERETVPHEQSEIEKAEFQVPPQQTINVTKPGPRSRKRSNSSGGTKRSPSYQGNQNIPVSPNAPLPDHSASQMRTGGIDDMEQTPVAMAIARYLGIELTPEGRAARRSRGIAVVVIGSPMSGKTETANVLSNTYGATLLTVDEIIKNAIESPQTPAAQKARNLCLEATRKHLLINRVAAANEDNDGKAMPAGMTAFRRTVMNVSAAHTLMQNRKPSTISNSGAGGPGNAAAAAAPAPTKHNAKTAQVTAKVEHTTGADLNTYILTGASPPPIVGPPITNKLGIFHDDPTMAAIDQNNQDGSNSSSVELESCVLPDDVLIQLISERLLRNDCGRGVVFDGLESIFCHNQSATAQVILHALNNRRYLYFVTLKKDYKAVKEADRLAEEKLKAEEEERKQKEAEWLREMSEEEWEQLPEEKRKEYEREMLRPRIEKKKRLKEEEELRRKQKEEQEERDRLEKDKLKKGGKKGQQASQEDKSKKSGKETSMGKQTRENTMLGHKDNSGGSGIERPESHMTHMSAEGEEGRKKGGGSKSIDKKTNKIDELFKEPTDPVIQEEIIRDPKKEAEYYLHQKFKTFEHEYEKILKILDDWDRCHPPIKSTGSVMDGEEEIGPTGAAGRKGVGNKQAAKSKASKVTEHGGGQDEDMSPDSGLANHDELLKIPNIIIDVPVLPETELPDISKLWSNLPTTQEVLEGLGLGEKGPPIPPESKYSIVKYPVKRSTPSMPEMIGDKGHYTFISTGMDEVEQKDVQQKEFEDDNRDDNVTVTSRSSKKGTVKSINTRKASGKKIGRRNSQATLHSSAPTPSSEDGKDDDNTEPAPSPTRWIVPAGSTIELKIKFRSDELGQFDLTLNFELIETRRKFQVLCRGICAFPSISREPRIVFPARKRTRESPQEIISKKYILDEEVFEFGPLLKQKNQKDIMDNKFEANYEDFTIQNKSPLPVEVNFSLRDDIKNERFQIKPNKMNLQPEESQTLTVWAYPRESKEFQDAIVCCVKENPEPVLFNISCQGVEPRLEIDKKLLVFDSVLLHRKDMKTIYLHNPTALPVFWKLSNLESLGEEFSFATDNGTVEPYSDFSLHAYFRSMKPLKIAPNKKNFRIDIHDHEHIASLINTETISIQAEAYDVALDMSFPRGANNGIDLGMIRPGGEKANQQISLKNKGPYKIHYRFALDPKYERKDEKKKLFTLVPDEGNLLPGDKVTIIQINFCAHEEVVINNEQILKCHLRESNMDNEGEEVAVIPIRISAKAIYSRFTMIPKADINFGAVVVHSKKTRYITITNTGEYDFKFTINKVQKGVATSQTPAAATAAAPVTTNKEGAAATASLKSKPSEGGGGAGGALGGAGGLIGGSQGKLQVGSFIVYPSSSVVPIKQSIDIIIDCISDNPGISDERLMIDVTDRNPKENGGHGSPYRLFVESFIPSIDINNLASIFEEHRIVETVSDSSLLQMMQKMRQDLPTKDQFNGGIYGRNENRFEFGAVLVGRPAEARFRLDNPCRVPCDVIMKIQGASNPHHKGGRGSASGNAASGEIFKIDPNKAVIEPRGQLYVTVTFVPAAMQQYSAIFDCSIDGIPSNSPHKSRGLTFDIAGEGYLPRISLIKPMLRNKRGQPLLLFNKTLISKTQTLPLEILNDGALNSRIHFDIIDPDNAFWITMDEHDNSGPRSSNESHSPHALILSMAVGVREIIYVKFQPSKTGKYSASCKISIVNNQYENSVISLIGEGYDDYLSFDNLPEFDKTSFMTLLGTSGSSGAVSSTSNKSSRQKESQNQQSNDEENAGKNNQLWFGECQVGGQGRSVSFNLTNRSNTNLNNAFSVRFQWPEESQSTSNQNVPITFSPSIGHLHPGQSIRITATLLCNQVKTWLDKPVQCKITKITFPDLEAGQKPLEWDDSKKTIKWIDSVQETNVSLAQPNLTATNGGSGNGGQRTSGSNSSNGIMRKKRVIETEPEPNYSEITGETPWNMELLISAIVDYAKFECVNEEIHFQETNLFEKRIFRWDLKNTGQIALKYRWDVLGIERSDSITARTDVTTRISSAGGYRTSRDSSRTADTSNSWDPDKAAFFVVPAEGVVLPGQEGKFEVVFSPLAVQLHRAQLQCLIENLDPNIPNPICIPVRGRALQPYCHFDLPESDYLEMGRRDPTLRGPGGAPPGTSLDPDTRVIEMQVVGIGSRSTKRFNVINPTHEGYNYELICEDLPLLKQEPLVRCLSSEGYIGPGSKSEIVFQFISNQVGLSETFWRFQIPELSIRVPFLIVGECKEPSVAFSKTHFKFPAILVGQETTDSVRLINLDKQSYQFWFHDSSRHSPGHDSVLRLDPIKGTLGPQSVTDVTISFRATPSHESHPNNQNPTTSHNEHNFNLMCSIEKMSGPLTLNVKAVSYNVQSSLWLDDINVTGGDRKSKEVPQWWDKGEDTVYKGEDIDFGRLELHQELRKSLVLVNSGGFEMAYDWSMNQNCPLRSFVKIEPIRGRVAAGQKVQFQIIILGHKPVSIYKELLRLQIDHGPEYHLLISADIRRPVLAFSFDRYDFGSTFQSDNNPGKKTVLVLENREASGVPVSVEIIENENSQLMHDLTKPHLLSSNEKLNIEIIWRPIKSGLFKENLEFLIGSSKTKMVVKFQGICEMVQLETLTVQSKRIHTLEMGTLQPEQTNSKTILLHNKSRSLAVKGRLSFANSSRADLPIFFKPDIGTELVLPPSSSEKNIQIQVNFIPKQRISKFSEEIHLEVSDTGASIPLFIITGCCHGHNIRLDVDSISFGLVTNGSSVTRKLLLINNGDIGDKFSWNTKNFKPDFSISPSSGYISPGMKVPLSITFHPSQPCPDIRYDNLKCTLESWKRILPLTLTGVCQSATPQKETLNFSCQVRQEDTKSLKINNPTNGVWLLRPVIDGANHWHGPETFSVEPQTIGHYELTYKPMVMSQDKKHQGSVFFPLPDGNGLMFVLNGNADPPKPKTIRQEVPARTKFNIPIQIEGWKSQPQRFVVTRDIGRTDKGGTGTGSSDCGISVKGYDWLELPGGKGVTREYRLGVLTQREGSAMIRVTFKDVEDEEYQIYEVIIKSIRAASQAPIEIIGPVRETGSYSVWLDGSGVNPGSSVSYQVSCTVPEVQCASQFQVVAGTKTPFHLEFTPLRIGESTGKLEFAISGSSNDSNASSSTISYEIKLIGTSPRPERPIIFNTFLGSSQTLPAKFRNLTKSKADFSTRLSDNTTWSCDKSITTAPLVDATLDITFEPTKLGITRGNLTLSSSTAGDFVFPLEGRTVLPKPIGPYNIRAGSTVSLPFRNVFPDPLTFTFSTDNSAFHIARNQELLKSKKDHRIVVGYDANVSEGPTTGKMIVICTDTSGASSANDAKELQWVYYLRGISKD